MMDVSGHTMVEFVDSACINIIYKAILNNKDIPQHTTDSQIEIPITAHNELMIFDFIDGKIFGYLLTKNKTVIDWASGK